MYSDYLKFNSSFWINIFILVNILLQFVFQTPVEQNEETLNKQKIILQSNDELSKIFFKNTQQQQTSFTNNSINPKISPHNRNSVSLIDLRNNNNGYRSFGSSILNSAKLNVKNRSCRQDTDSDFEDDDSSSIISGMTNLYLEKTRSNNSRISNRMKNASYNSSMVAIQPPKFTLKNSNIYMKGMC